MIARSVLPADGPALEFFRGMRGTIRVAFELVAPDAAHRRNSCVSSPSPERRRGEGRLARRSGEDGRERPPRTRARSKPKSPAAVKRKGARTVVMKGREYRGWVYVEAAEVKTKRELDYWVRLSLDYNKRAKASG